MGNVKYAFCLFLSLVTASAFAETIKIDGSSTVEPVLSAVAEEFGAANRGQKVTVGASGTGGGFKKLCLGEIDIANASRPVKKGEIESCQKAGVEFIELPIAFDAVTVAVNPKNTWANSLTVAELKKLWEPEAQAKITNWNQIRPEFPDMALKLFGPGVDSGSYDYFTAVVVGKEHASRGDYTSSEDDNVLVQGVSGNLSALGFFGLAYFTENSDKLKAVGIDDQNDANGAGPQLPSKENVVGGIYQPLSRPLFVYVNRKSAEREEVKKFVSFFMTEGSNLVSEVGYVSLPSEAYRLALSRFEKLITGSIFAGKGSQAGVTVEEILAKEQLP